MKVLYVSFVVVIVDQLTKLIVKGFSIPFLNFNYEGMYHGQRIPVIGDFFRLTFIENPGMAFGIDPGSGFKFWITLFSLLASVGLVIYLYFVRTQNFSLRLALAFILGGAVGNLIDRMFYGVFYNYAPLFFGHVVDFLDFDFFNISILGREYDRWPIFNIADTSVTIGVLILIIFYKQHNKEEEEVPEVVEGNIIEDENAPSVVEEGSETEACTDKDQIEIHINKEDKFDDGEPDKGKEIPL